MERIIHEVFEERARPVIKWVNCIQSALEYLSQCCVDELSQMTIARLWPTLPRFPDQDSDTIERSVKLSALVDRRLVADEHVGKLLEDKLHLEIAATTDPYADFDARMLASEIGWLETALSAVAARAVRAVEALLDIGYTERSEQIHHQLLVFEAFERGLLATWETPKQLLCLPIRAIA